MPKVWHLQNLTEPDFSPELQFLRREGAEAYKELERWPYINDQRWPLLQGGEVALDTVHFLAEAREAKIVVDRELEGVIWQEDGQLGYAPLLMGDCFDPRGWVAFSEADRLDPKIKPRILEAEYTLSQLA